MSKKNEMISIRLKLAKVILKKVLQFYPRPETASDFKGMRKHLQKQLDKYLSFKTKVSKVTLVDGKYTGSVSIETIKGVTPFLDFVLEEYVDKVQ